MMFGNPKDKTDYTLNLSLATTEHRVTVASKDCKGTTCKIPETWKKSDKTKFVRAVERSYYTTLEEGNDIGSTWFEGSMYNEDVAMMYTNSLNDEFYTSFNTDLVAIEDAAISFVDDCAGHVGLAPRDPDGDGEGNFMEQLIEQKVLDHHIFAIYINELKNKSVVKFGNWDKDAAHSTMTMISTVNATSWGLMTQKTYFGKEKFIFNSFKSDTRVVMLEPKYPYIYLPTDDWE